nr:ribonuclease E activity regulator RraA [Pseudoclavibacter sp. JAI123]
MRFDQALSGTCDLADLYGDDVRSCDAPMRDFGGRARFRGPIRTVRCYEDNSSVRAALSNRSDGEVLVVDGAGSLHVALLGDMIAELALSNGWSGVIVNGCVRDVRQLAALDLGVKAIGSNPRKSRKEGVGVVDVTLNFGGVVFKPGEHVYADEDGIVVTANRE